MRPQGEGQREDAPPRATQYDEMLHECALRVCVSMDDAEEQTENTDKQALPPPHRNVHLPPASQVYPPKGPAGASERTPKLMELKG